MSIDSGRTCARHCHFVEYHKQQRPIKDDQAESTLTLDEFDFAVVGAGMVGAAIGYGLAGLQQRVLMLDGEDTDLRAAKANFGLVWAHGKGLGRPEYQRLSVEACRAWPAFAGQLEAESGIDIGFQQTGGIHICLGEQEFAARAAQIRAWNDQAPELGAQASMLTRGEMFALFPSMRLGEEVTGGSFGKLDGHVNPLRLLAALQHSFRKRGGTLLPEHVVTRVGATPDGRCQVIAGTYRAIARRVVIAAGLGAAKLCPDLHLEVPLRPQRGQILVTERLASVLPLPASGLRQTAEGTVMIGATQEEVGFDLSTTTEASVRMLRRALRIIPELTKARLVRHWSSLRVMTPDGLPVYACSPSFPGVSIATCHSGVTLAAFHAGTYAKSLVDQAPLRNLGLFHPSRFHVQESQRTNP